MGIKEKLSEEEIEVDKTVDRQKQSIREQTRIGRWRHYLSNQYSHPLNLMTKEPV
ncbi:MAG TPA: hypothetical protein VEH06_01135 [Candidatus Bathyarchaeia archaeon]|nr:hypothetical protein [Candidatus Bathyarchaeia archaeon]